MLKKIKNQVTALGIMGLIGAGSLFSGIAAQNVYAEGTVAAENVTDPREKDLSETEVSSEALNETGTESDIAGEVSEEDAFSDDLLNGSESSGNDVAEETSTSSGVNAGNEDTRSDAEEKGSKPDIKEPETKPEEKTAGVGAVKDTKFVQAVKNGWVYEKGGYKYYKNGKAYTGWHQMGKAEGEKTAHWSYFGKDGRLYTGWRQMGKAEGEKTTHWSYFGSNGWLRTGWVEFGKGTKEPDGNSTRHWSYFGSNGWLRTGWIKFGKGTSESDGNSAVHWSYFGSNGWLRTGWVEFGKGTSEPDGNSAKHWSFFGDNGWLRTGLQELGKGTSNPDGNAAKHKSYFGANGWLTVNTTVVVTGTKYKADGRGWLSAVNTQNETKEQKIDNEYRSLLNWSSEVGANFSSLSNTEKARIIVLYVAGHFKHGADDCGSYTAVSMIDKRFGTCYGFSDLTRELSLKAGIKDAWLSIPGRMVDHGYKMYGSLHRTCVAYIDGAYYDMDSDSVYFNLQLILTDPVIGANYPLIEKISKSYAEYLIGRTSSYTSIN